jgi:hypothetical protein
MRTGDRRTTHIRRIVAVACASFFLLTPYVDGAIRRIPERVNIKAFARPENGQLEVLVRVPLAAAKDVEFPTRSTSGELDIPALQSMLPGIARYFIADVFRVFDQEALMGRPEVEATRLSISSDPSFNAYPSAVERFRAPDLASEEPVFLESVWLDIDYRLVPISPNGSIVVVPKVASLGVTVSTDLTYVAPDGTSRTFSFDGDPGAIYLDPRPSETLEEFFGRGLRFVITNTDVLLILFCLALPFRHYRHVVPVLFTFAGALAVAMLVATSGLTPRSLWFPLLVNMLTAAGIVLAAAANIAGRVTPRRRALLALAVGALVGFACAFRFAGEAQFAGSHPIAAAAAFGTSVLVAATAGLAALGPRLNRLYSSPGAHPLQGIRVAARPPDTAWWWLSERWTQLRRVPMNWSVDRDVIAAWLLMLAGVVLLIGVIWFVNQWLKSYAFADEEMTAPLGGWGAA